MIDDKGVIAMSLRTLRSLLNRAASGEDPGIIILEQMANSHQGDIVDWVQELKREQGLT